VHNSIKKHFNCKLNCTKAKLCSTSVSEQSRSSTCP